LESTNHTLQTDKAAEPFEIRGEPMNQDNLMTVLKTIVTNNCFLIAGSFYWGIRAVYYDYHYGESNTQSKHIPLPSNRQKHFMFWFIWAPYDFTFHAVGFLAGCWCLYVLAHRNAVPCHFHGLEIADVFLFIFSVLGLTGHLPQALYGFVKAFGELARVVTEKIAAPTDNK